jgi:AraC-like DNA-binding protein
MPEWEPGRNLLFYEIEPGCWGILVRFAGEASTRSETHERTAERLNASFDTALAEQGSAGFGYCCAASGVHQTAGGALEEAQEVLRHRMLLEPRSVLRPADIAPCRERFKLPAGLEAALKMAVEASRYKAVSELLDELCEQLLSARYTYDSVRLAYTRLVVLAFDYFGESIPPRTLPKLLEPTRFQSVRDMFFQLKSLYLSVINAKFRDYAFERTSIRLVYEVKAYIDVHYAEHLSLEHIAMERNLHASYLSTLFKDVLGVGFQDYVLRVRVGNAKMLMNTGHYKIKQVAEMTGFSSPNYFSSMFRKATGQSPKQFMAERLSVSPGIC